jgi:outer membrane lipoprotein-sorting protein
MTGLSAQDGREIMEMSREVARMPGLEAVSTLIIMDARGRERIRQTSMASKVYAATNTEKRIIRFLSPAEVKGTGMLIYDYDHENDDMWIYMPALRKTRRIISSEKSRSFMGSEFSNADMSAPNPDDFVYHMAGKEDIEGTSCWKVKVVPADEDVLDETGFDMKMVWIGQEDYVLRRAEYYDEDGELVKVLSASGIRLLDPAETKYLATRMEMENIQNGRTSVMTIDKVEFNPGVKDDYFTIDYLEGL